MIHRIPSGTRDVLPDETRELRAITESLQRVFAEHSYGELRTPALEYESILAREDMAEGRPAYRVFDESGALLALRSDMTVPIARVVASRYQSAPAPLRFSYLAHCYRGVGPRRGQPRELLQAGIELIGAPAPEGTAEALTILCRALDATGLRDYRVGLGDASLFPALAASLDLPGALTEDLLEALGRRDFVLLRERLEGWEGGSGGAGGASGAGGAGGAVSQEAARMLLELPQRRGGPEILEDLPESLDGAVGGLRELLGRLDEDVSDRMILDLGLIRKMGYYTGALFEVYDPGLGAPIGGGGRYDQLLGRFGRPLPAAGFALDVERLHEALAGEEQS